MTACYGNRDENEGYPLADWLWGHRLIDGQHWMEYLLEFLNVLAGFDYEFGQGVNDTRQSAYRRLKRLGLRRFVFYDEHEKTHHPQDDRASQLLLDVLSQEVIKTTTDDPLVLARQLLRSYSAIEEKRSWYAKSLFPAHQNLLFWEAHRKRKKPDKAIVDMSANELDVGVTFGAHNFFARGGEIYYLMLSAGTQANIPRRERITGRLRHLLNERNQEIGELAALIDRAWLELRQNNPDADDLTESATLGWIPAPTCGFYQIVAEDVDLLLQAQLDPLESLDLLAHLICFHVIEYIYHRAHIDVAASTCTTGQCLETGLPHLLVDCLDRRDGGIMRQFSATVYKEQEQCQVETARNYVWTQVQLWAAHVRSANLAGKLTTEAESHFGIAGLDRDSKVREAYELHVENARKQFQRGKIDRAQYLRTYANALTELLMDGFTKQFIGVHRKLARNIGFVAPKQGRNPRYVLGDTLLKALVLANVPTDSEMAYDEFLSCLYTRYGLVVGQHEAKLAGLSDRRSINTGYFENNRAALLTKMKSAGLLREYSDATAMVRSVHA